MKYALSVKQSLLFTDLSLVGCSPKYFKKVLGINYSFPECLIRGDDIFWNYDNDIVFDKALLNKRTLNNAVKHFNKSLTKTTKNLEDVTANITKSKNFDKGKKELELLFNKYIDAYLLNMPFLFHFWNIENLLINQLKKDFEEIFGNNGQTVLQQALVPSQETYFSKERKSLENIALYIFRNPNHPKLESMLGEHIRNFAFTSFVLMLGIPQNRNLVWERIQELLKEGIAKKIKTRHKQEQEDKRRVQQVLGKLSPHPDIYQRVLLAQQLMFWKNQRLDIFFKSDLKVKPLFDGIAKLIGIPFEEFVYLRYEEIKLWFKNGRLPTRNEIEKRQHSYALYLKNDKILLYTDKNKYPKLEADSKNDLKIEFSDNVLQGNIAYKGKITGKVRLVNLTEDIKEIQKGEILITKMTRPEMIIGLEKAAAFVTDQGGMLSHAAIVSREMKKPCIVGTKIATLIFKNGDLIEVDAYKGIVRKLA